MKAIKSSVLSIPTRAFARKGRTLTRFSEQDQEFVEIDCEVTQGLYDRMKKFTEQYGKLHFEQAPKGQIKNEFID